MSTKQIFLSQLPDVVKRLVEDFPQLEVILTNMQDTEVGSVLDILNQHETKITSARANIITLQSKTKTHDTDIAGLKADTGKLRTDVDTLTGRVDQKTDGLKINGGLMAGNVNLASGANIHFNVDPATNTVTISASGTNAADGVPVGTIAFFGAMTAPAGWMECDGRTLLRDEYPELFQVLTTVFGTTTGSDFKIPDLRAEFIRGWDHGRGVDASRGFGTAQADMFKSHVHNMNYTEGTDTNGDNSWWFESAAGSVQNSFNKNTDATGGTETRPRNIALLPCIRVKPVEKTLAEAVAAIEGRMDTIEPIVNDNATQVSALKSTVNTLDTQLTSVQTVITAIQSSDAVISQQLSDLSTLVYSIKSELEEVKAVMAANYVSYLDFDALKDRVTTIEGTVAGLQTSIDNLVAQITGINTTVTDMNTVVEGIHADVQTMQENVDTLTVTVSDAATKVDGVFTDVETLKTSVTTLNTDVPKLKTDVGTLKTDVSTLKTDMTTAKADISTLQIEVADAVADVAALQTTAGDNAAAITSMQSDVSAAQANVTALQTDMSIVGSNITALQGNMATVQDDLTTTKADLATMTDVANNTASELSTTKDLVAEVQVDLTYTNDNVTALQTTVADHETRIKALEPTPPEEPPVDGGTTP